jgi:copper chaperone
MSTHTYTVEGMSCAHCVAAVTAEVGQIPGVTGVNVDLATRLVAVTGDQVEAACVIAAIDEAGYDAVPA